MGISNRKLLFLSENGPLFKKNLNKNVHFQKSPFNFFQKWTVFDRNEPINTIVRLKI